MGTPLIAFIIAWPSFCLLLFLLDYARSASAGTGRYRPAGKAIAGNIAVALLFAGLIAYLAFTNS